MILTGLRPWGGRGCFGSVHVNPWITFLAIDLPAIAELLLVSQHIREMTVSRRHSNEIDAQARKEGMTSLLLSGVDKVHQGITTYDEVLKATKGTVVID